MATISNLVIDANADYSSTVTISSIASDGTETPFDLTGYTVSASIRKTIRLSYCNGVCYYGRP